MILALNKVKKTSEYQKSAEEKLLLLCLGEGKNPRRTEQISELIQQSIDWDEFEYLVLQHDVVGLVSRSLEPVRDQLPPEISANLDRYFNLLVMSNLFLTGELARLSGLFDENGIPFLVLKGPVLAEAIYDKAILRHFSDLDLLVPEQHYVAARQLILANGFYHDYEKHVKMPKYTKDFQRDYHEVFRHPDKNVKIELHWSVASPMLFPITTAELWNHLEIIPVFNMHLQNPSPEDLILILSIHGYKHTWARLKWLCDIGEFVGHYPHTNWSVIIDKARSLRIRRVLLLNLYLAHRLLGTQLPDEVFSHIRQDELIEALADYAEYYIFNGKSTPIDQAKSVVFQADGRERFQDKFVFSLQYATSFISTRPSALFRKVGFSVLVLPWLIFRLLPWNHHVRAGANPIETAQGVT